MNEKKNVKRNIFFTIGVGLLGVLVHTFTGFFLTPKITNELGIEVYGFASLARNFVSYTSIATIAINAFAARYLTISYNLNNEKEFKEYYSTVYIGNVFLTGVLTLISFVCIWKLEYIISIPDNLISDIKLLFLLFFIQFFIATLANVYGLTGYIKDKMHWIQIVNTISYLVDIVAILLFFWVATPVIWYIGLVSIIVSLFLLIGNICIKTKWLPHARPRLSEFSFFALKKLIVNGTWSAINSLGNTLNSGLDLLISNLMLSAAGMGQIAIAKTFITITSAITSTAAKAFHPTFLKGYALDSKKELLRDLKFSMKICAIPTNIIVVGFCALGVPFLTLWVPNQDTNMLYYLIILAFLPSLAEGPMYPLYFINTLTLKNRIPCFVTIIGGVLNVGSMYILLKYTTLGVYAVLLTTAVIMCLINLVFNPIYLSYSLGVKRSTFFPGVIRNIVSTLISYVIVMIICMMLPSVTSWRQLFINGFLIGLILLILQLVTLFSPHELVRMLNKIKKRFM